PFLVGTGKGWVTAEYAMLPGSTPVRKPRERGKTDARSQEIQRLIGRALRSAVDMDKLGERTIYIDCDCIGADGGTRTASITGGYIALVLAIKSLINDGIILENPIKNAVAAISVGISGNEQLLDLCYAEDSVAEVDMNVVMNSSGEFIEIQGTGEGRSFSFDEMQSLLTLAGEGIERLLDIQKQAIGEF
ncbi:MAG TPA: ribonuclease PH, partial [Clostridia bacterium]|nr:ribonuclease PH [Clostridia bacterium]